MPLPKHEVASVTEPVARVHVVSAWLHLLQKRNMGVATNDQIQCRVPSQLLDGPLPQGPRPTLFRLARSPFAILGS